MKKKQAPSADASAQLKRLLAMVPRIADGEEHSMASIGAMLGATPDTIANDLVSFGERYDTPGGFVEGLQVFIEAQKVSVRTSHFLRPMRLTVAELRALDLGLGMIRSERPAEEWAAIDQARERVRAVAAKLPAEAPSDRPYALAGGAGPDDKLAVVRDALAKRRKLSIVYRRGDATAATTRVVCPYRLILAGPGWYLVAHCDRSNGVRVFRVDRIEDAQMLGEGYAAPAPEALSANLDNGPVFESDAPATLRVRYSPAIARWIRERMEGDVEADGSYVVEHPLADVDWALRHVLQYGSEAEILEPATVRRAVRDRLRSMLDALR